MVRRPRDYVIGLLALGALAGSFISGLLLDASSFAGNLLAEGVGLIIGLLLAVVVAERFVEAARRDRWARVQGAVFRSIRDHLEETVPHALEWVDPTDEEFDQLVSADLTTTLRIIGSNYRKRAPRIPSEMEANRRMHIRESTPGETIWDNGEDWTTTEPILKVVREEIQALDALTVQVFDLGDERLSELMVALTQAGRVWVRAVRVVREEHGEDGGEALSEFSQAELTWWAAGSFYLAAAALSEHVGRDPNEDSLFSAEVRNYVAEHEPRGCPISTIWFKSPPSESSG